MLNTTQNITKQKLDILWSPTEDGVRILRVYGEHPCLSLPEHINDRPVTEIGPYCFSRSAPNLPKDYFHYTENSPSDESHRELSCLSGDFVEEVILPSSVTTLHNAAFYNCRNLRVLSAGSSIKSIGSDEFMNCIRLEQLILRCEDRASSGLPLILERIADNLEVMFMPKGTVTSALFFPEYYEWLDEISPAHLFSRSIHGEGFRMRKCFENNRIDYVKYDRCFERALTTESGLTLCKIALNRLRWPNELKPKYHLLYARTLGQHLKDSLPLAINRQDRELLCFLCTHFSAEINYSEALRLCIEAGWGEGSALLMEEKHRHNVSNQKSFTFDEW